MDCAENPASARADWIATTRWSLVLAAGKASGPGAQEALEILCRTYWQPLYIYARRHGQSPHDAQDITQAFFAHFLEKGYIRAADPARGRFRAFLLTSFRHYLSGDRIKASAAKRGGAVAFVPWDDDGSASLEDRVAISQGNGAVSAERDYDRGWARAVVAQALRRLQTELAGAGKAALFTQLKPFLTRPADQAACASAGAALGLSPGAVSVAVHRLRQRCGELFRDEVAQTVARPDDLDDERRYLLELLAGD